MLDKVQMPFCISTPTSVLVQAALSGTSEKLRAARTMKSRLNQDFLIKGLARPTLAGLGVGSPVSGTDAEFIIVPILNRSLSQRDQERAKMLTTILKSKNGIAVRFVGEVLYCEACLRITVGTEWEVVQLMKGWRSRSGSLSRLVDL